MNWPPEFLTLEDLFEIHADQIGLYGGTHGLRDLGLLESAAAQPLAGFGEEFFHPDIYAMSAAYLFHLVSNHPFLDGNKRVGLAAAATFLALNGYHITATDDSLVELTLGVATGTIGKTEVATFFRDHTQPLA